jgi:hypothetical protein
MTGRTSARSRIRCGICGERVDPWGRLDYPRVAAEAGAVQMSGLQECSECGRRGCPSCLRVVEERADDFFFDRFACVGCLKKEKRRTP